TPWLLRISGPTRARRVSSVTSRPRQTSSPIRATCPTPPRRSTSPIRCARKSFTSPKTGSTADGGARHSVISTWLPVGPPPRCARCGRAPPRRGAWSQPSRGRTLLRAAAYEQLGRRAEAREEYREVLSQWKSADQSLRPFIRQAELGLARVGEAG